MHGRVKVRSSEEEKLRKEKERQQKVMIFQKAMKKIQAKRNEGQLDKEILDITGQVLSSNPDIYTLWNIRRYTVKVLSKTEEDNDVITRLYDDELSLTEYCLKVNPKSYCAWHQREWVLTTRSDPDWKKELGLCEKYLRLDERNFHTWDYRRFVVAHYKPPLKEEFDFTTEKIHENFSNYSAWHYRSKMLVELYPDLEAGRPIEDSHHKHELELVMNAAFTDPDDTSAWFYQRWLLGAVKDTTQAVVCTVTPNKATVAFNKHVTKDFVMSKINLTIGDAKVVGQWIPCTGNMYDNLWICAIQENIVEDLDIKLEFETETGEKTVISCTKQDATTYVGKSNVNFQKQYSNPVIEELKKQLKSCRQLLDFEPDNKWTLLTTTVFLHCIDPMVYHEETISNLQTLKHLDKLRAGYYNDLITKWSIEEQIRRDRAKSSNELRIVFNQKITSLPHLQFYSHCGNVDLSNQSLASNCLGSLVVLQHCKILNLENNDLTMLKNFPKLDLKELNLKGNNLNAEEVKQFAENVNYSVLY